MKIAVGSDKSGFSLKEEVKKHLVSLGYEVEDLGMTDPDGFKPYYEVAPVVARKVQKGEVEKAVLICGTGAGMCIVANKFKGVYAVAVESSYSARMSKIINKANIITMGGWLIAPQQAIDMVNRWLEADFTEGFPADRRKFLCGALEEIKKLEEINFK
ncbi:MAG: RpiB/LacA/LacB family sugar-phosphate isomerase [Firmicutes bacterium]|nr:RpiB/LacA/LacB family sugar-phosphate isomerase [Bacillota bacterium]